MPFATNPPLPATGYQRRKRANALDFDIGNLPPLTRTTTNVENERVCSFSMLVHITTYHHPTPISTKRRVHFCTRFFVADAAEQHGEVKTSPSPSLASSTQRGGAYLLVVPFFPFSTQRGGGFLLAVLFVFFRHSKEVSTSSLCCLSVFRRNEEVPTFSLCYLFFFRCSEGVPTSSLICLSVFRYNEEVHLLVAPFFPFRRNEDVPTSLHCLSFFRRNEEVHLLIELFFPFSTQQCI